MSTSSTEVLATISANGRNRFKINGVLNFETVPVLLADALSLLSSSDDIIVDFAGVDDSNSAGLALLLELARQMRSKNKSIHFQSIPEQMSVVARAYGIESEVDSNHDWQDLLST